MTRTVMMKALSVAICLMMMPLPGIAADTPSGSGASSEGPSGSPGQAFPGPVMALTAPRARAPHDPIHIEGDADFTSANGVSGGTGTEVDPYIIEDWEIIDRDENGMSVENTTSHFIARNLYCDISGPLEVGFYLYNITNATLQECTILNATEGVLAYRSRNLTFISNRIIDPDDNGIYLYGDCTDCLIAQNRIELAYTSGMTLEDNCGRNTIRSNQFIDCGVYLLDQSYDTVIDRNRFEYSEHTTWAFYAGMDSGSRISDNVFNMTPSSGGICTMSSSNLTISNNTIRNAYLAIQFSVDNTTVRNNTFDVNVCGITICGDDNRLTGNRFYNSSSVGVEIGFGSNGLVEGNEVSGCVNGVIAYGATDLSVSNNSICGSDEIGIRLTCRGTNVTRNDISGNLVGLEERSFSGGNNISGNSIHDNTIGISLNGSRSPKIGPNRIENNSKSGIDINASRFAGVSGCELVNNGVTLGGKVLSDFGTHDFRDTTVNGRPLAYIVNESGVVVPPAAGQVILVNCSGFTMEDMTISNTTVPLTVAYTINGTVSNCTLSGRDRGLYLRNSELEMVDSSISTPENSSDIYFERSDTSVPSKLVSIDTFFNMSRITFTERFWTEDTLDVFWHVELHVNDSASSRPVSGAQAWLRNSYGLVTQLGTTYEDGIIGDILVRAQTIGRNGTKDFNPMNFSVRAPDYVDNWSKPHVNITRPMDHDIRLDDIGLPWSEIGPLPKVQLARDMALPFLSSDSGSGIAFVEIFYDNGSGWRLFSDSRGISRFPASPVNFTNLTADGWYRFYTIASDHAGNVQPGPYNVSSLLLDNTTPECTITPGDNSIVGNRAVEVVVAFNEPMDRASVEISIEPGSWRESWTDDNATIYLNPQEVLDFGTYNVSLSGRDRAGRPLAPRYSSFTLAEPDIEPPYIMSLDPPANSSLAVGPTRISITFSEPMNRSSVESAISVNGGPIPAGNWTDLTCTIDLEVVAGQTYTFSIGPTARDLAGNCLAASSTWKYLPSVKPGSISGYIYLEDNLNRPAAGAIVTCQGRLVRTDAGGQFNMTGLMPGNYSIMVSGVELHYENNTSCILLEGQNVLLSIGLRAHPGTLRGSVVDSGGKPIAGAKITIIPGAGASKMRFDADLSGNFNISLPPGNYTVLVARPGSNLFSKSAVHIKGDETTDLGTIEPPAGAGGALDSPPIHWVLAAICGILACAGALAIVKKRRRIAPGPLQKPASADFEEE